VHAAIHDVFVDMLAARVNALRIAPASDPATQVGPLINTRALEKVERHVQDALNNGARLVTGGQRRADLGPTFYQPAILTDANETMAFTREETFGPVAPIVRFEDETAVIAAANATPYGLAAYFYSQDPRRIARVASALEAGMLGINAGIISSAAAPFGGIKASGYGREGSQHGLDEYTHLKYLCQGQLA